MRTRTFGRLGWPVSEVGYGMWGMGGWTGSDDGESLAALALSLQRGCTFFDTASAYGAGHSERLLGRLRSQYPHAPFRIATKVPPKNHRWPGRAEDDLRHVFPRDHVWKFTEASLGHFGVDTIDLQQFHVWSDAWAEQDEWQRTVADLKAQRLIRGFGISVNRWEPTNVLAALRTGLVDAVQVVYNIFDQAPDDELLPYCAAHGVAVIARVPFDEGGLTGALRHDSSWPEGDWRNLYFTPARLSETLSRVERLEPLLPDGMTLSELALRFILANPAVATTIPGMRRLAHVEANLGVSDGESLPPRLLSALRAHRWDRVSDVP